MGLAFIYFEANTYSSHILLKPKIYVRICLQTWITFQARLIGNDDVCEQTERIILSLIWTLAHNNHRAKVVLQQSGITKRVRDEFQRRSMKRRSGAKLEDNLMEAVMNILIVDRPSSSQRK